MSEDPEATVDEAESPPTPEAESPPMPGDETTAADIVRRIESTPISRATYEILSDDELRRVWRTSAALAQSGMFKDATQASQAFAKIMIGRDLGLSATVALRTIDFVEGQIQLRGVLLASFLRQSADYDYEIVSLDATSEPEDDQHATVRILRRSRVTGEWAALVPEITYTVAQARHLKSFSGEKASKMPWHTARRNMLLWRALSDAVKFHAPDLLGGVPVYTEADDFGTAPEALTAATGSGEAPGVDLGPKVDAVLEQARRLGHRGLADRATAEMALMGKTPADVDAWVEQAKAALERFKAGDPEPVEVVDAEVVGDGEQAQVDDTRAGALRGDEGHQDAESTGSPTPAAAPRGASGPSASADLREQAEALRDEAGELAADDPNGLDKLDQADALDAQADQLEAGAE